jgi:hypothetical protein
MQNAQLTIGLIDDKLDDEEKDTLARRILAEMRKLDEIEQLGLAVKPEQDLDAKSGILETLIGVLTMDISLDNLREVFGCLNRFSDQTIELEVESEDRRIKIKVRDQSGLEKAFELAQEFLQK